MTDQFFISMINHVYFYEIFIILLCLCYAVYVVAQRKLGWEFNLTASIFLIFVVIAMVMYKYNLYTLVDEFNSFESLRKTGLERIVFVLALIGVTTIKIIAKKACLLYVNKEVMKIKGLIETEMEKLLHNVVPLNANEDDRRLITSVVIELQRRLILTASLLESKFGNANSGRKINELPQGKPCGISLNLHDKKTGAASLHFM